MVLEKIQERICLGQCNLEESGAVYGNGQAEKASDICDIFGSSCLVLHSKAGNDLKNEF